jgi:hypothetical protein
VRHYVRIRAALRPTSRLPTVVVQQPGHVGSSSLVNSIRTAADGPRVLHPHRLTQRRDEAGRLDPRAASFEIDELQLVRALRRRPDLPLDVISIVRDPVARNLNMFLYQHRDLLGARERDDLIVELVARFRTDWLGRREPFERFFNNDFVPMWKVEVNDFELDPDAGVHRVERPGRRHVVLRTDRLDRAHIALASCLGSRSRQSSTNDVATRWATAPSVPPSSGHSTFPTSTSTACTAHRWFDTSSPTTRSMCFGSGGLARGDCAPSTYGD